MKLHVMLPPLAPADPPRRVASRAPRPRPAGGLGQRLLQRLSRRFQERWPIIQCQLPRDLLIVSWVFLAGQAYSLELLQTDSIRTSVVLVIKGATVAPGELAVFGYTGQAIPLYYPDNLLYRLRDAAGMAPSRDGPRRGDGFVKFVVGVPGDRIEVVGQQVVLQTRRGRLDVGRCKPASRNGVPLEPIKPQVIPEGYVYVWAPHVDALDSRYAVMGLVPRTAITGRAVRLW